MAARAPFLAVLMTVAFSAAATAQALRPSLSASAAMPSPKEQVTVGAGAFAAISQLVAPLWTTKFKAGRRADYEPLVAALAKANDVPEELVHRVIVRESKYQPNLIGRGGCIGMMQIKLATARGMGYTGDTEGLLDARTNLIWGVKYLAGAWRAAQGDADLAVRKYAAGYYVRRGARTATSR